MQRTDPRTAADASGAGRVGASDGYSSASSSSALRSVAPPIGVTDRTKSRADISLWRHDRRPRTLDLRMAIAVRVCLGTRCIPLSAPGFSRMIEGQPCGRSRHQGACPHAPPRFRRQVRDRRPRHASIQAYLGIAIQNTTRIRLWLRSDSRSSSEIDQGGEPIKPACGCEAVLFDRLSLGNSPYDLPRQLSRKNQRRRQQGPF